MARKSSLTAADIKRIPFDKKQRAELVKQIAKSEGVTVRTAQRRITEAGQKRGQSKSLSIKEGNAVRRFLRDNPIIEYEARGRTKSEAKGNLLVQQVYSTQEEAMDRAEQLKLWADGSPDTGDDDLYPGSLFDNVHTIEVQYVPPGSKYNEFDVRYSDDDDSELGERVTAPSEGIWIVKGYN